MCANYIRDSVKLRSATNSLMVVQKQEWKAVIILHSEHGTSVNNIESQRYKFNLKARCLVVFDCRFNFSTDFNTL